MSASWRFLLPAWLAILSASAGWGAQASANLNSQPPPFETTRDAFLETVTNNFAVWDDNHDQTLSREELDTAIENPANKGPAAAALAALRHQTSTERSPPLTLANIRKLAFGPLTTSYKRFLEKISRVTHREVFVSGLPQLSTIHQGDIGNCFTLAPLGALIGRDPREVAAWFEAQSNGNVLVKMPAGAVSAPPPTDAELAVASGNTQDGLWLNLYEKAIGQARNERKPPGKRFEVALDAIARGGDEATILSYITGHKVSVYGLKFDRDPAKAAAKMTQLREKMTRAKSNKLVMVCATFETSTPGLMSPHGYAVLNYDSSADTVKLWNPYGNKFQPKGQPGLIHGYPTTNGIFTMPLTDFVTQFGRVDIERSERTRLKWTDQWELMAQAGRFAEAATDLTEVIDTDESQDWKLYMLTPLLIESGRTADYTNHCKSMLDQFENTADPSIAERTAKSCLLLPRAVSGNDLARAARLAARAVSMSKKGAWLHWRLMTRGLAEYRSGHYQDALRTEALAQKAAAHARDLNGPACEADAFLVSAMARVKLNRKAEAQNDLGSALKMVETRLPKLDCGDLGARWFDTLMTHILLREARGAVQEKSAF